MARFDVHLIRAWRENVTEPHINRAAKIVWFTALFSCVAVEGAFGAKHYSAWYFVAIPIPIIIMALAWTISILDFVKTMKSKYGPWVERYL